MPIFTTFDPYYKWLGIPRSEQPPNHYRLLGLNLYESDLEVIESAADQRMDYLRTFQNGPCVERSQQLLNQVAASRVCLLNPQRKREYDNGLKLRMAGGLPPSLRFGQMAALFPVPPGGALPPTFGNAAFGCLDRPPAVALPPTPAPTPDRIRENSDSSAAALITNEAPDAVELDKLGINAPHTHFPKRPTMPLAIWLTWPLIASLVVAVVIVITGKLQESIDREMVNAGKPGGASATSANSERALQQPAPQQNNMRGSQPAVRIAKGNSGRSRDPAGDNRPIAVNPLPQDSQPTTEAIDDETPNPFTQAPSLRVAELPAAPTTARTNNETIQPAAGSRLPVPSPESQQKALQEIHDVMREEFAAAIAAGGQQTLARKLEELGADTNDDSVMRYMLLAQALEAAVKGGDAQFAEVLVNRLTAVYDVDVWQLRLETWPRLLQSVSTVEGRTALVEQSIQVIEKSINDDRYDVAGRLVGLATAAARSLDDQAIEERVRACAENLKRMQAADAKANKALDRLQIQPNDPDANLVVGTFRCFDKQDWQSGLRFLVRGGDDELQQLARQELAGLQTSLDQLKLANAWWDLAERMGDDQGEPARQSIRTHAVDWYRKALPHLSGLALLKAQKRIAEQHPNP